MRRLQKTIEFPSQQLQLYNGQSATDYVLMLIPFRKAMTSLRSDVKKIIS